MSYLARPTGFEPAISSVTGRRTRPTIPRAQVKTNTILSNFENKIKGFFSLFFAQNVIQLYWFADVAQLVEQRIRNA